MIDTLVYSDKIDNRGIKWRIHYNMDGSWRRTEFTSDYRLVVWRKLCELFGLPQP